MYLTKVMRNKLVNRFHKIIYLILDFLFMNLESKQSSAHKFCQMFIFRYYFFSNKMLAMLLWLKEKNIYNPITIITVIKSICHL